MQERRLRSPFITRLIRGLGAGLFLGMAMPASAQEVSVAVETAADGTRSLTHEVIVPVAPDQVWQAVATIEGWLTWAVPRARPVPGSARFETGYDPSAAPGASDSIEQEWIVREPPHRVSFRTTRTPAGFPHADAYLRVVSTFTLTPIGSAATRVRLTGTGYEAGENGDALIAFFLEGNRTTLQQLHARFASGPIDWAAQREAAAGQ